LTDNRRLPSLQQALLINIKTTWATYLSNNLRSHLIPNPISYQIPARLIISDKMEINMQSTNAYSENWSISIFRKSTLKMSKGATFSK